MGRQFELSVKNEKILNKQNSIMLNHIKQQTRHYLVLFDLKSKIKTEECQEKTLKSDLEKLQREVFEVSGCIDTIKWKIKRAEFILSCEKERHKSLYTVIEAAEDAIWKDEFYQQKKTYDSDVNNYKIQLQKEKNLLTEQLRELT